MQKNILIFLVVCFVILSLFLFFKDDKGQNYVDNKGDIDSASEEGQLTDAKKEKKKSEQKITYSRISFFHTKPVYASFSIPSDWEGKYRMKEQGDTVSFLYINGGDGNNLIFSVQLLKQSDNNKAFASKYGYDFILLDNSDNNTTNDELNAMRGHVKTILNSIKIFKIN